MTERAKAVQRIGAMLYWSERLGVEDPEFPEAYEQLGCWYSDEPAGDGQMGTLADLRGDV